MAHDPSRVCVARIGAPHGVRGAVRLFVFTAEPEAVRAYGPLETASGDRRLTLRTLRPAKSAFVAEFAEIGDRTAAEALRNVELFVPRDRLPEADEEEWYHADLVGLRVRDAAGREVGEVVAVQDFGGGDLLEVRYAGEGRTVYVPFTRAVVPTIDVAAGFVVVEPPAGLLDEAPGGEAAP